MYNDEFYVVDITFFYNCLIGRPWIHSAIMVSSFLHQQLKFVIDNHLVSIIEEEELIAIDLNEKNVECSFI
ncbi:hypothetical protein CRYUN_Cryun40dG0051800 [Craigia yunnanensis]